MTSRVLTRPSGMISHGNSQCFFFLTVTGGACGDTTQRLGEGPRGSSLFPPGITRGVEQQLKRFKKYLRCLEISACPLTTYSQLWEHAHVPEGARELLQVLKAFPKLPSYFCIWSCHFIKFFWSCSWPKLSTFLLTSTFATSLFTPRLLIKHLTILVWVSLSRAPHYESVSLLELAIYSTPIYNQILIRDRTLPLTLWLPSFLNSFLYGCLSKGFWMSE